MRKSISFILLLFVIGAGQILSLSLYAQQTTSFMVEVKNDSSFDKEFEPVVICLNEMNPGFRVRSAVVRDGNLDISSQLDDLTGDGQVDELAFVLNMPANTCKELKVELSSEKKENPYPAQVFAEMLISDKRGKHPSITSLTIPGSSNVYNQLHHHGPAFESELVAYRIYFDHKQTVDIYGKFNKGFEIEESQFYPTDEQLARGFGDDVLMVGGSCGLGTLKGWNGQKATHIESVRTLTETIRAYGPLRTVVDVAVQDWEYQNTELDMTVRYILYAGHRDCEVQVFFTTPLENQTFAIGVINMKDSDSFSDHAGLIACWGTDWPVGDTIKYAKETVGLATCLPPEIIREEVADNVNYLYTIESPGTTGFTYHITFTSMKETFGYKTKEEWFGYVQEWKKRLSAPCQVSIRP
ncbi:MAG: DUF4861 domain-containing protein [Tannerellaceae bacterium]|nr:DUF4861 domain-containing protein [Tannerellaceae bacterium]